jgi:hypothetical protein
MVGVSALRSFRPVAAGEVLLEEDLGRDVVNRSARRAACGSRAPARFVGSEELFLKNDLHSELGECLGEKLCAARCGPPGAIFSGRQADNDTRSTVFSGDGEYLSGRTIDALVGNNLEGRRQTSHVVADREAHPLSAGIHS